MYSNQETDQKQKRTFKKNVDMDECRSKRREGGVTLRRNKREEMIQKKRRESHVDPQANSEDNQVNQSNKNNVVADINDLNKYLEWINADDKDAQTQYQGTLHIRKLLSVESNPPIDDVLNTGCIDKLTHFLTRIDCKELQFEACWALTNIASGTSDHTVAVVQAGACDHLVTVLNHFTEDHELCEQAVWALGNIAGDSAACRDHLLSLDALPALLNLIGTEGTPIGTKRNAVWSVSNLCRGKPIPSYEKVKIAIQPLVYLVENDPDDDVRQDSTWALSYLSDGPNDRVAAVVDQGVVPILVKMLRHCKSSMQVPALRTLGNIATGTDQQTQCVLDAGILETMPALLQHSKKSIRKEACWTLSNITAGSARQITTVVQADLMPHIITLMGSTNTAQDIKKECIWCISNATSGGSLDHIDHLAMNGVIEALVSVLDLNDTKLLQVALECIDNILRAGEDQKKRMEEQGQNCDNIYISTLTECGGPDKLEKLQQHQNSGIYETALGIMTSFLDVEEDEGEAMPEQSNDGGFNFGSKKESVSESSPFGKTSTPFKGSTTPFKGGSNFGGNSNQQSPFAQSNSDDRFDF